MHSAQSARSVEQRGLSPRRIAEKSTMSKAALVNNPAGSDSLGSLKAHR
jgi:hypothetical protein